MQYLLNENEMLELHEAAGLVSQSKDKIIQELCTRIACMEQVQYITGDTPQQNVWGCILLEEDHPLSQGYCDECPVQEECPCKHKRWSQ